MTIPVSASLNSKVYINCEWYQICSLLSFISIFVCISNFWFIIKILWKVCSLSVFMIKCTKANYPDKKTLIIIMFVSHLANIFITDRPTSIDHNNYLLPLPTLVLFCVSCCSCPSLAEITHYALVLFYRLPDCLLPGTKYLQTE